MEKMALFSQTEQAELHAFFASSNIFGNHARDMITLIYQIQKREKMSVADILKKAECSKILADDTIQGKRRIKLIKNNLFIMRYPESVKILDRYYGLLKKLSPPSEVTFKNPSNMEKKELFVHFRIKGKEDLKRINQYLRKLESSNTIDEILSL